MATVLEMANQYAEWLISDEIQSLISNYGVESYGMAVYFPENE